MLIKIQRFALALLVMASVSYSVAFAVPRNAFYLRNGSTKTLHFSYGCLGAKKLYNRFLYGHYGSYFWSNKGCRAYTIVKSTRSGGGTTTFRYRLNAGWRYELFWDASRGAWNVRQINTNASG